MHGVDLAGRVAVSVLDFAPIVAGSTATQALRDTLDLARRTERLGYRRYWFNEHHDTLSLAASVPSLLVAEVAGVTERIRVGVGGALLANHRPLVVAEQFGTLAAFHPGRVDLGVSPSLGAFSPAAALALRGDTGPVDPGLFAERTEELLRLMNPEPGAAAAAVTPRPDTWPPVWLHGRNEDEGALAGRLGLPFVFGYHFTPHTADKAIQAYRAAFRPSEQLPRPYVIVDVMVLLADSEEQALYLTGPLEVAGLQIRDGYIDAYLRPEDVEKAGYSPEQRAEARAQFADQVVGDPATGRRKLTELLERTGADELMAITIITDHAARVHSYELLAEISADLPTG